MKTKRILVILIACILFLTPVTIALANEEPLPLNIRQVSVNKPEVVVYFDLPDDIPDQFILNTEDHRVTASLAGEELVPVSFEPFENSGEGVWYIFVVDVSTSMTSRQIASIRSSIEDIAETMGANDRFTLISFGVTVDVLVDLSNDEQEIIDAAGTLIANQRGTLFYDSIIKAFELASRYSTDIPVRRAVFVFSDAEDFNVGGFIQQEVEDMLVQSEVALYAMGFNNRTRDALDAFGAKARMTLDGGIDIVTQRDVGDAVKARTDSMRAGYIARFASRSNIVSGNVESLNLEVGSLESVMFRAAANVNSVRWIADNTPPVVISARQTASETIQIVFSKPMLGADRLENYSIKDIDENLIVVRAVIYNDAENIATLAIDPPPGLNTFTLSFHGITDLSMERNITEQSVTIDFTGEEIVPEPTPEPIEPPPPIIIEEPTSPYIWLLGSLIITLIILGITMAVIKSRGGLVKVDGKLRFTGVRKQNTYVSEEEADVIQHKFVTAKLPEINIRIMDGSNRTRDINTPVKGSLFVGRAAGNDLVFDDKRMSRQHFAIEAKDGSFNIVNLSETSGTLLNGVKIGSSRPINKGDKIEAGNITFTIL